MSQLPNTQSSVPLAEKQRWQRGVSVLFAVIGIVVLLVGILEIRSAQAAEERVVTLPGQVVRLNAGGSHPEIEFIAPDGQVESFPAGGLISGYRVGQRVDVSYDPKNPAHPALKGTGSQFGFPIMTVLLGSVFLLVGLIRLFWKGDNHVISPATAPHYTWADVCDGWKLVDTPTLSVIQERMPSGTQEIWHRHSRVRQFFYVLSGELTLEVEGKVCTLGPLQGLEISPGQAHQARNESVGDVEFLVISNGISREDREEV